MMILLFHEMDHYNLWYDILNYFDFGTHLSFVFTCKLINHIYPINNLCDINKKYLSKFDDYTLRFFNPVKLKIIIEKIRDISHMHRLKILEIDGSSYIDSEILRKLDLVELHLNNNYIISNLSGMKNLKVLHISGSVSAINQSSIWGLNLVELKLMETYNITDVSFMKNLKILYACGTGGISGMKHF